MPGGKPLQRVLAGMQPLDILRYTKIPGMTALTFFLLLSSLLACQIVAMADTHSIRFYTGSKPTNLVRGATLLEVVLLQNAKTL